MGNIENKQQMIRHCREQLRYYIKCIRDCSDANYLRYYQGQLVAYESMLANLGFDIKFEVKLVSIEV